MREQGWHSIGMDGAIVSREEAARPIGRVTPALIVSLVLALVLVAAIGEFHQQRLGRPRQRFAVEYANNFIAFLSGFHPRKTHTAALAATVAQHSGRDDRPIFVKHIVKVLFGDVRRQVGQVQISGILFLLLLILFRFCFVFLNQDDFD